MVGRPRIHEDRAGKQWAYRQRKEQKDFDRLANAEKIASRAVAVAKLAGFGCEDLDATIFALNELYAHFQRSGPITILALIELEALRSESVVEREDVNICAL